MFFLSSLSFLLATLMRVSSHLKIFKFLNHVTVGVKSPFFIRTFPTEVLLPLFLCGLCSRIAIQQLGHFGSPHCPLLFGYLGYILIPGASSGPEMSPALRASACGRGSGLSSGPATQHWSPPLSTGHLAPSPQGGAGPAALAHRRHGSTLWSRR